MQKTKIAQAVKKVELELKEEKQADITRCVRLSAAFAPLLIVLKAQRGDYREEEGG